MKLYSLLTEEQVKLNLQASTLDEAVEEMLLPVEERLAPVGRERIKAMLLERERNLSTSVIEGVCLPHARVEGLQEFILLVGSTPKGVQLSGDAQAARVNLIIIILTPQMKNTLMLQTLAAVARLLSSAKTRQALINVKTPARALKIIEESGVDVKKTLCANDIMRPAEIVARPDMPLTVALDLLAESPDEGIPVLNEAGEFVGELCTSDIIAVGLPKYMDLMENPSLLGNIEPFEQFFQRERNLKVKDLTREQAMLVSPDTPVVQIAHRMQREHRRRAYVMKDRKLVGMIFRKDIITRVLQL